MLDVKRTVWEHTEWVIFYIAAAVVVVSFVLSVAILTGIGSHRRGTRLPLSVLAGTVFPITWAVWYVHDEQPYLRTHHHHLDRS